VIAQEVSVSEGQNIAVTVGAGGAGGTSNHAWGGNGAPGFVLVEW
jgi:hypothetical protein